VSTFASASGGGVSATAGARGSDDVWVVVQPVIKATLAALASKNERRMGNSAIYRIAAS
jgi:hypothetical protein